MHSVLGITVNTEKHYLFIPLTRVFVPLYIWEDRSFHRQRNFTPWTSYRAPAHCPSLPNSNTLLREIKRPFPVAFLEGSVFCVLMITNPSLHHRDVIICPQYTCVLTGLWFVGSIIHPGTVISVSTLGWPDGAELGTNRERAEANHC